MTEAEKINLLTHHIIFDDTTISFTTLNDLYNACDLYVSPYLCEGFGLTMLEALATGLSVLVPRTGSTREYMADLDQHGGHDLITYVDSTVTKIANDKMMNLISVDAVVNGILNATRSPPSAAQQQTVHMYIAQKYSWDSVSKLLFEYLNSLISTVNVA